MIFGSRRLGFPPSKKVREAWLLEPISSCRPSEADATPRRLATLGFAWGGVASRRHAQLGHACSASGALLNKYLNRGHSLRGRVRRGAPRLWFL